MVFGVVFYSFAIGNLSKLLTTMDQRAVEHKNIVNNFKDFAKKAKLPEVLQKKIERFLE